MFLLFASSYQIDAKSSYGCWAIVDECKEGLSLKVRKTFNEIVIEIQSMSKNETLPLEGYEREQFYAAIETIKKTLKSSEYSISTKQSVEKFLNALKPRVALIDPCA